MKYIIFTLFVFFIVPPVYGCSCEGESTVAGGVKAANLVAVGTVIGRDLITLVDTEQIKLNPDTSAHKFYPYSIRIAKYTIVIDQVFKGKLTSDTIIIYTGLGGGDCGNRFLVGEKYIVYGSKQTYFGTENNGYNYPRGQNIYWTNICTRTILSNEKEIAEIKAITKTR
jgi:hypothetical protein